jgi:hypothetical protein
MKLGMRYVCALAGAGAMMALLGASSSIRQEPVELTWQTDYAAAQKSALQAGKPLFVVFR